MLPHHFFIPLYIQHLPVGSHTILSLPPMPSFLKMILCDDLAKRVKNTILATVLLFYSGSYYSFGVFSLPIEQIAHPPGCLDGMWASAMSLVTPFAVPAGVFTGIYLSEGVSPSICRNVHVLSSKTFRMRVLVAAASLAMATLSLAGIGVSVNSQLICRVVLALSNCACITCTLFRLHSNSITTKKL